MIFFNDLILKKRMKSFSKLFSLAFQMSSWKKYEPFWGTEQPRSVCITPQKLVISGSNFGNVVYQDVQRDKTWKIKLDDFPVYHLQSNSKFLTIAQTKQDSVFLLDDQGEIQEKIKWNNLTMTQFSTPSGMYARLSSNHWLSCWKKGEWTSSRLDIKEKDFVVQGKCMGEFFFFLTLDWKVYVFLWKDRNQFEKKCVFPLQPNFEEKNMALHFDIICKSESPLFYRMVITGKKKIKVFDLDLVKNQYQEKNNYKIEGGKKSLFMNADQIIFLTRKGIGFTNEFGVFYKDDSFYQIDTDYTTHFEYLSPLLIYNDHHSIFIKNMITIKE